MTPRESKLTVALHANVALRIQAERPIAAYVSPESDQPAVINQLIALFDGPEQREAQRLAAEALSKASENGGGEDRSRATHSPVSCVNRSSAPAARKVE